ncbi:hypothetical protein MZA99_01005 [Haemophilus influenzae]
MRGLARHSDVIDDVENELHALIASVKQTNPECLMSAPVYWEVVSSLLACLRGSFQRHFAKSPKAADDLEWYLARLLPDTEE